MSKKYQMVIGGLGDDAHSIGIHLLALGFEEAGFNVLRLGIRNTVQNFFDLVDDYDVFLISNKNGHAELYLENFSKLLGEYKISRNQPKLWYLGGSLSVSESDFQIKKKFLSQGFTNVYPRPVDFRVLLEEIRMDLDRFSIPKRPSRVRKWPAFQKTLEFPAELSDKKWDNEYLFTWRKKVLEEWPTGKDVKYDTVAPTVVASRSMDWLQKRSRRNHAGPLLQPRTGVADIEEQLTKLKTLEANGSNISSVQLDAACRSKLYSKAANGIHLSLKRQRSVLNGFPIPVYGVSEVGRLVRSLNNPFQLRGGGPDHRFTYEIALQAGISGLEGGGLSYLLPYDKTTDPVSSMLAWQYIDRLCGIHCEKYNVHINREYFGVLTAALIAPSLAIVVNIIEALLSAQQGVKSISVGYAEQGNRSQDIAAIRVLNALTNAYLERFGFTDCFVTTVFHQYMAAFPTDRNKSIELIHQSFVTAKLAGADRVMIKTAAEAINIPTTQDNVDALGICKGAGLEAARSFLDVTKISFEEALITKEVNQIMAAVIESGNGSITRGVVTALRDGIIDIPWSPNVYNRNEVLSIRDKDGAVRYMKFGNLPFNAEVKELNNELLCDRIKAERDPSTFSLLEKDLTRIAKNDYLKWPLDDAYVN